MLTDEEVIEGLLKLAQTLKQDEEASNELDLSPEEKAFYDCLSRPEECRRVFKDDDFLALT